MHKDYEKLQYREQRETNVVLWINTGFTIIAGVATTIVAILSYMK